MKNAISKSPKILSVLAGLACFLSVGNVVAADAALRGHVPAVVKSLKAIGELPGTNTLQIAIGLPVRNKEAMESLLRQMYDPKSPNYRKFITPGQYTELFGPTENDYQAVVAFAKASGLTVTRTHGNRMLVDVAGKVSDIENAFHVKLQMYHHPTENRDFYAPDTEPTVGSGLSILHISGLDNYLKPKAMYVKRPAGAAAGNGSGPFGTYIGQDFRNAYVPGAKLMGSGQTVGLLQFDGYFTSDITTYEGLAGLTNVPLHNVLLDGVSGLPGANNLEVCLDIEMSVSMAPALAQVVVFEGLVPDDILNSMAASNQIKQLSSSWGYPVDSVTEQIYKEFALQGQTYLNCSGDGDAWVGGIPLGACQDTNTTIVGGTTLTMDPTASFYVSEQAWNWGYTGDTEWNSFGYTGTSGGISANVAIPYWQQGINMTTNQGSTVWRNVPDVALTADNIFNVSSGGEEQAVGGTSAATPLWAGYIALLNQQAAINGASSVGFLAPQVYALAKTASYANYFHDTMIGSNIWIGSPTNFFAVPGYDLCTGLGTPNGTNLINVLSVATNGGSFTYQVSAPPEPYGTNMAAMNGGSPNGNWDLFIQDNGHFNTGMVSNGWSVTFTLGSPVGSASDLGVSMTANEPAVPLGGSVTFYVSVTNFGGLSTATNVIVEDLLPAGATYLASSATSGSIGVTNTAVEWYLGNLAANQGGTLSLTMDVPDLVTNLPNYAFATSETPDLNPADDSYTLYVTVAPISAPQLSAKYGSTNGGFNLTITGGTNTATIVYASTNLITWVPVYTNAAPYTSPFIFTDSTRTNYHYRFYKALTLP